MENMLQLWICLSASGESPYPDFMRKPASYVPWSSASGMTIC
jgi:hypothetical protein